jgi:hypothetical protein
LKKAGGKDKGVECQDHQKMPLAALRKGKKVEHLCLIP